MIGWVLILLFIGSPPTIGTLVPNGPAPIAATTAHFQSEASCQSAGQHMRGAYASMAVQWSCERDDVDLQSYHNNFCVGTCPPVHPPCPSSYYADGDYCLPTCFGAACSMNNIH